MTSVVFLLVPQLNLLDLASPAHVFSAAARMGHDYRLSYVAEQEDVPSAQGVPLRADPTWPELTADDLVVVPGWRVSLTGTTGGLGAASVQRLARHHAEGGTVASVCAGAYALGLAGLLDGRRCTTHHSLQEDLARRYPKATVVRDVLHTVDDRVVTSAGLASGSDLALHLIATRHGPAVAAGIARSMIVYARRNGSEQQTSALLRHRAHINDTVHRVQDLIDAEFTRTLPLAELASTAAVSERTLTRAFRNTIGMTPLRYQQVLRVELAEHLLGHGATVEAAARAVGFQDARMLRRLRAQNRPHR